MVELEIYWEGGGLAPVCVRYRAIRSDDNMSCSGNFHFPSGVVVSIWWVLSEVIHVLPRWWVEGR